MPYAKIEDQRAARKRYYERNREKEIQKSMAWKQNNRERAREINRDSNRRRRAVAKAAQELRKKRLQAFGKALLMEIEK